MVEDLFVPLCLLSWLTIFDMTTVSVSFARVIHGPCARRCLNPDRCNFFFWVAGVHFLQGK